MGQFIKNNFALMICLFILLSSVILVSTPNLSADNTSIKPWNESWSYHQHIQLPIDTSSEHAHYQPIDMLITFDNPCWGVNETLHSIRILCWNESNWDELDAQIYNLEKTDDTTIIQCNIVFLIPWYATGEESYYVFYDDSSKEYPDYVDHVQLLDKYYYYEPITGISVEGDYYEIREDDYIIYGVGQKGKVLNRHLSQIAIRMKPGTKKFDMLKTDLLTSFCFSYLNGAEDEDEIASDAELLAKEILVDGNLMVRFRLVSQSQNKELFTSNVYTYYYHPGDDKRISVTVHHEIKDDLRIKEEKNGDGRFGTIISYHSKSPNLKKMEFGKILPYVFVSTDKGIRDYSLEQDPENSEREWIISYNDNCNIGPDSWLAYGNGDTGKTHGLIFSSNTGIITNGSDERDGIEIKVAEKEYLDVISAEVDYASIGFGRNAFEPDETHDLTIDKGLEVTFDVEFYSTNDGGYERIKQESQFFRQLVSFRDVEISNGSGAQNIYTLTVIPHLFGRILSYPFLRNLTGINLPVITAELYRNQTMVDSCMVEKPLIGFQNLRFPKLEKASYQVRLYRLYPSGEKKYIGTGCIDLKNDAILHIYCTWEQDVTVWVTDQNDHGLADVILEIYQDDSIIASSISKSFPQVKIPVPFNIFKSYVTTDLKNISFNSLFQRSDPYLLKAYYKGFCIYNSSINLFSPSAEMIIPIYDVVLELKDELGLPPDITLTPSITSQDMTIKTIIQPTVILKPGRYQFRDLPEATYSAYVSYAGHINEETFTIPDSGSLISLDFSAKQSLHIKVLTNRGELIDSSDFNVSVSRDNNEVVYNTVDEPIFLPPGTYVLSIFDDGELIGSDIVELTSDKTLSVVTIIPSVIYVFVTFTAIIILAEIALFYFFRKISLNTALKLVILGVVLVGIMQPWWTFYGESEDGSVMKSSKMFLYPSAMVEEYVVDDTQYLSLATIPEVFTDFVYTLLLIISGGMILLLFSFIPNMLLHKRFEFLLAASGIVFMLLVSAAFFIGMNQIAQLSLGSLRGEGLLTISPPYNADVIVYASWGLGPGFFIVFFGACIAVFAGVLDYYKKHKPLMQKIRRIKPKK